MADDKDTARRVPVTTVGDLLLKYGTRSIPLAVEQLIAHADNVPTHVATMLGEMMADLESVLVGLSAARPEWHGPAVMKENVFAVLVTEDQLRLLADLICPDLGLMRGPRVRDWVREVERRLLAAAESTTGLTHPEGRAVLLPGVPE